ncbi:hypothetical protein V5O48_011423 [Marasmius crinis-equi]|uniref:Protein kinase domain-containing protein n=1 Tax=Marasmius crinis-equi TaxID=585013 RepID=A0ABR3F5M6_9AGAR
MSPSPPKVPVQDDRSPEDANGKYLREVFDGGLTEYEVFWRDRQQWLEKQGYMLRPRFHPGWVPSWIGSNRLRLKFEDGASFLRTAYMLDARRISDGAIVVLKKVQLQEASLGLPRELRMAQLLRTEPYASDPRNNFVPIFEILMLPDADNMAIMVMPLLRRWDAPLFETVGEAVEFCRQMFEGLQFMHQHHIAHNDIKNNNIMADTRPLYDVDLHPCSPVRSYDWKRNISAKSRTRRPINYFYIDYDLCEQYDPAAGPAQKMPPYGGDQSIPEFTRNPHQPCDPFAVDVYCLGNVIREGITGGAPTEFSKPLDPAFTFLRPLISDMTQDDPTKRPNMDEVVSRFNEIVKKLGEFKLRSRIAVAAPDALTSPRSAPVHWVRQLFNFITRVPAIPAPTSTKK